VGRETPPKGGEHATRQIEANIAQLRQGQPGAKHASASTNLEDDIPCLGLGHRQHSAYDGLAVLLGQANTLVIGCGLHIKPGVTIAHSSSQSFVITGRLGSPQCLFVGDTPQLSLTLHIRNS
jgi:hypothetical protein